MPVPQRNIGQQFTNQGVSPSTTEPAEPLQSVEQALKPYIALGMDLTIKGGQAEGDCPFCGKEGKFTVKRATSQWRCFVCGTGNERGGGNPIAFIQLLHAHALERTNNAFYSAIATDRKLCSATTVKEWGVVQNPLPPYNWLVPAYNPEGKVHQLYRRVLIEGRQRLIPTPGIHPDGRVHGLHTAISEYNPKYPIVFICEGPWDGMALWEVVKGSKTDPCQVIAVPGCNVWQDSWTKMCAGKEVVLLFDSDHPRIEGSKKFIAGYDGMKRIARRLSGHAAAVKWLQWGEEGFDPNKPNGWDLRDELSGPLANRRVIMNDVMKKVIDAPPDWFSPNEQFYVSGTGRRPTEARECNTWEACENAWRGAMYWRETMAHSLAVLLAVCASTQQAGNQLFVDLVGSPGSAKTTICRGLLVSEHCIHLENISKILTGFKKRDDPDKDCSFLARANGKTWITCEFDTLGSSAQYHELMGKMRRIFDGETSATYGNDDKDRIYQALRTPWIRAGTFKMIDHDQSQVGDRFLRCIMDDPKQEEKRGIMDSALDSELSAMMEASNVTAGSIVDEKTRIAHALTGGYVNWLRENVNSLLPTINVLQEAKERCKDLAELVADLRARPIEEKIKREHYDTKELPTRLSKQNIRLAMHLAVVLNKKTIDKEVLNIVRKVALDTACGHSLKVVSYLCQRNPRTPSLSYQFSGGLGTQTLSMKLQMSVEKTEAYLSFLQRIGVLSMQKKGKSDMWILTDRLVDMYTRIMKD